MRSLGGADTNDFRAFCDKHSPKDYQEKVDLNYFLKLAINELSHPSPKKRRNAKQQNLLKSPIIPSDTLHKIATLNLAIAPKKREEIVGRIARYWALKKESRRGAALLKRLHIEVVFFNVAMDI